MRYNPKTSELCQKAVDAIYGAFDWSRTPQGYDYWSEVVSTLRQHEATAKEQAPKQAEIVELRRRLNELESRL